MTTREITNPFTDLNVLNSEDHPPLSRTLPLIVLYHGGNCRDGFCAAWLTRLAFPHAEFVAVNYGDVPPDVAGKQVMIVDFCFPLDVLVHLQATCVGSIVLLDHHPTAADTICAFTRAEENATEPYAWYCLGKSGARMTWEFLYEYGYLKDSILCNASQYSKSEPHWLVLYTEDRDLWAWMLPESKAVNTGIRLEPLDFDAWDDMVTKSNVLERAEIGAIIMRRDRQIIDSHVRHAAEFQFDGHTILNVNCTGDLISEVCGELAVGRPFAMTYFDTEDGYRVYSLRSDPNGLNVGEIAKKYGGGGHEHAAGFRIPVEWTFPLSDVMKDDDRDSEEIDAIPSRLFISVRSYGLCDQDGKTIKRISMGNQRCIAAPNRPLDLISDLVCEMFDACRYSNKAAFQADKAEFLKTLACMEVSLDPVPKDDQDSPDSESAEPAVETAD